MKEISEKSGKNVARVIGLCSYKTTNYKLVGILMPLYKTDLKGYIKEQTVNGRFPSQLFLLNLLRQIFRGVYQLHEIKKFKF